MATITYTISGGVPPFVAKIVPSAIPVNNHTALGTYSFTDVPDGNYFLDISDGNECEFSTPLTVNTGAQTNVPQGDSIVIGNTNITTEIFNIDSTNITTHYVGSPDVNVVELYLWLKTYNGEPLTTGSILTYTISGDTNINNFEFNNLSDEINAEVIEIDSGISPLISGTIELKIGFIETFFKFTYYKDPANPNFDINLTSPSNNLCNTIPLISDMNIYGVYYVDNNNIIMKF